MRTAVFFGLIVIAKALNYDTTHGMSTLIAVFTAVMMAMDVIEFIKNLTKE